MKVEQEITKSVCTRSLKLLGDFWTLSILNALEAGEMRYCALQRATGNPNPVTLGTRLRRLQDAGLIERLPSNEDISVSYRLTELGSAALPVVAAIDTFSRQLPGDEHSSLE
jgi:DNA-binding HxlR family transcriptional regulator